MNNLNSLIRSFLNHHEVLEDIDDIGYFLEEFGEQILDDLKDLQVRPDPGSTSQFEPFLTEYTLEQYFGVRP